MKLRIISYANVPSLSVLYLLRNFEKSLIPDDLKCARKTFKIKSFSDLLKLVLHEFILIIPTSWNTLDYNF